MKLPKNPTPEQIKAIVQLIIRSTFTRGSLSVESVTVTGGEARGTFLGNGVPFRYTIKPGLIDYAPVNPGDLPDEDGADFMEDALDFARLKLAGNTKQVKACKKGYACGYTCISQNRNCRKPLPGQAKTAAEWVAQQEGVSSGGAPAKGKSSKPQSSRGLKPTDTEDEEKLSITATSKPGDIAAYKKDPYFQGLALKAAHQYAKKDGNDHFIFENPDLMTSIYRVASSQDRAKIMDLARNSAKTKRGDRGLYATAIRVSPDGSVHRTKVFFNL